MKNRLITALAFICCSAGLLGQSIAPVWYETRVENFNVTDENRLPIFRIQTPPGTGPNNDNGTRRTAIDVYAGLYRYDDTRLLLGIRSNGIDEDNVDLSDEEKALAKRFPDRSIEWINAETGAPMGTAFQIGVDDDGFGIVHPDIDINSADGVDLEGVLFTAEWLAHPDFQTDVDGDGTVTPEENEFGAGDGSSGSYYWQWNMDDAVSAGEVPAIYMGWANKVLRYAPADGATVENPSWSSTATVAYQEDSPGRGSGAMNGARWQQFRIVNLHITGHGADTEIMIHGETWRAGVHPQFLVTTDGKRFYKEILDDDLNVVKAGGRVNNRSGGNLNGHSSGGGPTLPLNVQTINAAGESVPADPSAPNLLSIYNGHYPNGNWNSGKTRYDHNPDSPILHGGPGLLNVPLFQGNNGARGSLPQWSYEQSAAPSNNDHRISGVEVYDGFWAQEFESSSDLDYIVVVNTPSWNNQHGGGAANQKPGWLGVHQLNGSQSNSENKAFKVDALDWREADIGTDANSSFLGTSAQLEVNPTGDGNAEVLWANGHFSFGRAEVTTHPITAPTVQPEFVGGGLNSPIGTDATLAAGGFTGSPITLQWYKDGEPIAPQDGEGNSTGSIAWNQLDMDLDFINPTADNNGVYKLRAWNTAGFMETAAVTVTFDPDPTPPSLVGTSSLEGFSIGLQFAARVDPATAEVIGNYDVRDADGNSVTIDEVVLRPDGRSIQLAAANLSTDTFTVTVSGVTSVSGVEIVAGEGDSAEGAVQGFFAVDIGSPINAAGQTFTIAPNEFEVTTGHGDIWGAADIFYFITEERTGDLDVSVQVVSAGTGGSRFGLMARESTAANSRHIENSMQVNGTTWQHIRRDTGGGSARWRADDQPAAGPFPDLYVRLKRHANDWTAWRSTDGNSWEYLAEEKAFDLGPTVLFGIAQSHTAVGQYANYGTVEYPNAVIEITEHPADNVPNDETLEGYQGRTATFTASARALRDPDVYFQTSIDGAQVTPAIDPVPAGTGSGTMWLDGTTLHVNVSYTGLGSAISNAHIHDAGDLIGLMGIHTPALDGDGNDDPTAGSFVGSVEVSASQIDLIRTGVSYVNIHTADNPGGEIRGQVVAEELHAAELGYQWRSNGTPLADKTDQSFTTNLLTLDDDGATIDVVVSVSGIDSVTSDSATLDVVPDVVDPVLTSLAALNTFQIGLCYNELLDADSVANATFTLAGADGDAVFDAVLRPDGMTVALSILINDGAAETFELTIDGVTDLAGNGSVVTMTGPVIGLEVFTLGNNTGSAFSCWENTVELTSAGGDIWGNADNGIIVTELREDDFDVIVQVDQKTGNSNRNGLMVRETTSADSRHLNNTYRELANGDTWQHIRRETGQGTARIRPDDQRPNADSPNRWVRINRQGDNYTLWRSSDGLAWEFMAREDNFDLGRPVEPEQLGSHALPQLR